MRQIVIALVTATIVATTACGGVNSTAGVGGLKSPAPTAYPTPIGGLGHRPSTPVVIKIISPTNGEVVHGTTLTVRVSVTGGTITSLYSRDISATKGHVHLYLNNQLIFMSYTLSQPIEVQRGLEYSMHAEFVGQDHYPFDPRDVTPTLFFTVASA